MTSLADVALAFCKECLGWEDAEKRWRDDWAPNPSNDYIYSEKPVGKSLVYTDLDAVLSAVRGWLRSSRLSFKQHHELQTSLAFQVQEWLDGLAATDSLCHALLAACVEASRKLKGAA